jgi:hypothetical protein
VEGVGCYPLFDFCFDFNPWCAIGRVAYSQGDQIGRIFAQLVIVCLHMLHENYRSSPNFLGYFIQKYVYALI